MSHRSIEGESVSKVKFRGSCRGAAGGAVSAGIRRVRSGFGRQRQPMGVGELRRSHRPPEVIDVFGFEERDRGVSHTKIDQGEEARTLFKVQIVRNRRRLGDLVPAILNLASPELSDDGLLRSACCAIYLANALHLSQVLNVFLAG